MNRAVTPPTDAYASVDFFSAVPVASLSRRQLLGSALAAACSLPGISAWGQPDAARAADERLRHLIESARANGTAKTGGNNVALSPARVEERAQALAAGEAALIRLDVDGAQRAFDHAASILHAADTEIALVRTYMQAGEYRRALAFCAHTAIAHRETSGGAALYGWLLHLGGQDAVAARVFDEASQRLPGDTLLASVRTALKTHPRASGQLLGLPARLAPYAFGAAPSQAQVVASAVLIGQGNAAITMQHTLGNKHSVWLRNGLGQEVAARVESGFDKSGLCLLKLERALPTPALACAARDPFPGSPAFALEYIAARDATPAWPVLRSGFLGAAADGMRQLGIALSSATHGGPVFDLAGRLIGIAVNGKVQEGAGFIACSELLKLGIALVPATPGAAIPAAVDQIYEASLRMALQVII